MAFSLGFCARFFFASGLVMLWIGLSVATITNDYCQLPSGNDGVLQLDCTGKQPETAYTFNFSKSLYNPDQDEMIITGKDVIFALNSDLRLKQQVSTYSARTETRSSCVRACQNCTEFRQNLGIQEHFCNSYPKNTCPRVLSERCSNWFGHLMPGGLDSEGNRLALTCGTNYQRPSCQLRQMKDLSNVLYEFPSDVSPDFFTRRATITLYDGSALSVNSSKHLTQPYFMAGSVRYQEIIFNYPQFEFNYQTSISRRNSASRGQSDIFQNNWDLNRLNTHITSDVQFMNSFSYKSFLLQVVQDYGRPQTNALKLYDLVYQPYVVGLCKNDAGIRIGPDSIHGKYTQSISTLVRTILLCESREGEAVQTDSYFLYRHLTGSTVISIKGVQFLFGTFNTLSGQPQGAAICAYKLESIIQHFQSVRNEDDISTCPPGAFHGLNCETSATRAGPPSETPRQIRERSTAFNALSQTHPFTGIRDDKPLWHRDGARLLNIGALHVAQTTYFFSVYDDMSVGVFSFDTTGTTTSTRAVLQRLVPISSPQRLFEVFSISGVSQWSAAIVTTTYQVIKVPAIDCSVRHSCQECLGITGGYRDTNCGWCSGLGSCTSQTACPANWIVSTVNANPSVCPKNETPGVYIAVSIDSLSSSSTINADSSSRLVCTAVGSGTVNFTWTNVITGKAISNSGDGRITITAESRSSTLHFNRVLVSEGGLYQCSAANNFSSAMRQTNIYISPYITSQPTPLNLFLGQSQLLSCGVGGYPLPFKVWFKDEVAVDVGSPGFIITADRNLYLRDARLAHGGTYRCDARSPVGVNCSMDVKVNVHNAKAPLSSDSVLKEGDNHTLSCRAAGPSVRWTRDGKVLSVTSSSLTLSQVSASDMGTYVCSNFDGPTFFNTSGSFKVIVESPPQFFTRPSDVHVTAGERAGFTCQAVNTFPPASISWSFSPTLTENRTLLDSPNVTTQHFIAVTNSNQRVDIFQTQRKAAGFYFCTLTNNLGTLSHTAQLTVAVPPRIVRCQLSKQISVEVDTVTQVPLSCASEGDEVVFFHGEEKIAEMTTPMDSSGESLVTIMVDNPTVGSYSCRAKRGNTMDKTNCSWVLWSTVVATKPGTGPDIAASSGSSGGYSDGVVAGVCTATAVIALLIGVMVGLFFGHREKRVFSPEVLPENTTASYNIFRRDNGHCIDSYDGNGSLSQGKVGTLINRPVSTATNMTDVSSNIDPRRSLHGDQSPNRYSTMEGKRLSLISDAAERSIHSQASYRGSAVTPSTPGSVHLYNGIGSPGSEGFTNSPPPLQRQTSKV